MSSQNGHSASAGHFVGRLSTEDLFERRRRVLRALRGPMTMEAIEDWKEQVEIASIGLLPHGLLVNLYDDPYRELTDAVLQDDGALGRGGRRKIALALIKAWRLSLYRLVFRDNPDGVHRGPPPSDLNLADAKEWV